MAFDGFVMKNIVDELNTTILDSKVNKIFSPTKNDILFNLYSLGKTYNLLINSSAENCRICISNSQKKNPITPSNFCMLLRKHLTGSRIIEFKTFGLERVVEIIFECYSETTGITTKKIIAEIMNRYSNIILTDSDNTLIGSLKYCGKLVYSLPDSTKTNFLDVLSFEDFLQIVQKEKSDNLISKLLNSFTGMSKSLAYNILEKNNIDSKLFSKSDLQFIFEHLKNLLKTNCNYIKFDSFKLGNKNDYSPSISTVPNNSATFLNEFIDTFYFEKETKENFLNEKYRVEKAISIHFKKCKKKLENIESKLVECENMDMYRIYGELLNSNLYRISNLRSNFVELENYYENNKIIKIPLDISISTKKNAEKYFKKYRKLKNASQIVLLQKEETLKELSYLETILFSISIVQSPDELSEIASEIREVFNEKTQKNKSTKKTIKKTSVVSFNLEKIEVDGYTIYIGKNNKQNEFLTLKFANRNDIWFHIQDLPGSHIVLKTNNLELTDEIIYKCASLAKQYSKGSNSLNVSIDYTPIKNIKKSPSGKLGMVIYNVCKTIII